ncbi:MAB_1171c family putative transporter [Nocardia sp. NPDC050712]|uniref:MAB_1171c family putative transporter n=1 Tax=Nocardia sp. NPDC050712 TaxID=3155518 RepID=UPI003402BF1E
MNVPVPPWLGALAIAFVALIAVSRWFLVDDTISDRLVNRALTLHGLSLFVEECGARTDFADLTYRLFLGIGVLSIASIHGLAVLWAGADPHTARARQRWYDLVAVPAAVVIVVIGRPADPAEPGFWWQAPVVWAILNVPFVVMAIRIGKASAGELRAGRTALRERILFSVILIIALYWMYSAVAAGVRVFGGQPLNSPAAEFTVGPLVAGAALTAVTAVPLIDVLLSRTSLDRVGRHHRKLQPLWQDLISAVPDVVLDQGAGRTRNPELRLYRQIVEIRDALQRLRYYMPTEHVPKRGRRGEADRIARAIRAKAGGASPNSASHIENPEGMRDDMAAELEYLRALSRVWPAARARVLDGPRSELSATR